jgi:hypothetical protein
MGCSARHAEHQLAQKFSIATLPLKSLLLTLPEPKSEGTLKLGSLSPLMPDEYANERVEESSLHNKVNIKNNMVKGINSLILRSVIMIFVRFYSQ